MTKKISQLPSADTLVGSELFEIVQNGQSKKTSLSSVALSSTDYNGTWVFGDNSNNEPNWPIGKWGETSDGRFSPGDEGYVQALSLIFITNSGILYR